MIEKKVSEKMKRDIEKKSQVSASSLSVVPESQLHPCYFSYDFRRVVISVTLCVCRYPLPHATAGQWRPLISEWQRYPLVVAPCVGAHFPLVDGDERGGPSQSNHSDISSL